MMPLKSPYQQLKTLNFVNIWSKEVIVNVSYPSTFNQIDGYMNLSISPKSVTYTFSINMVCIEVHK